MVMTVMVSNTRLKVLLLLSLPQHPLMIHDEMQINSLKTLKVKQNKSKTNDQEVMQHQPIETINIKLSSKEFEIDQTKSREFERSKLYLHRNKKIT